MLSAFADKSIVVGRDVWLQPDLPASVLCFGLNDYVGLYTH
jgi:hypothetical protein